MHPHATKTSKLRNEPSGTIRRAPLQRTRARARSENADRSQWRIQARAEDRCCGTNPIEAKQIGSKTFAMHCQRGFSAAASMRRLRNEAKGAFRRALAGILP